HPRGTVARRNCVSRQTLRVTSARAESRMPPGGDGRAEGEVSFSKKPVAPAYSRGQHGLRRRGRGGTGCTQTSPTTANRADAAGRPSRSDRRAQPRDDVGTPRAAPDAWLLGSGYRPRGSIADENVPVLGPPLVKSNGLLRCSRQA